MSKTVLRRFWNGDPADLRNHKIIGGVFEDVRCDIRVGRVFPALRENEIHLYHEGGRVLRIRKNSAYTHRKYKHGSGNGEISLSRLTRERYEAIKKGCRSHNSKPLCGRNRHRETWIVSRLFKRFSCWSDGRCPNQPKLIDIEVRLRPDAGNSAQMIDLLFLDNARLTFVEVKRQYDDRIRSKNKPPEVVKQIRGYECSLSRNRDVVVRAYHEVSRTLGTALCLPGFESPKDIFHRVPVLVCRRDVKPGQDKWLGHHLSLCAKNEIDSAHLVVDGGAICKKAYEDQPHPSWCRHGLWEQMDLGKIFDTIHDIEGSSSV